MISDFTKNKIFELNTLLREYFQDMDTTDDRLYALSLQVDDLRITVPKKFMMRQNCLFAKILQTLYPTMEKGAMRKLIMNALKSFSP